MNKTIQKALCCLCAFAILLHAGNIPVVRAEKPPVSQRTKEAENSIQETEDFYYSMSNDSQGKFYYIMGVKPHVSYAKIPEQINGLPVKEIFLSPSDIDRCGANMQTMYIPDSIEKIVYITGCPALTAFEVSPASTKYCTIDGVLYTKDRKTLIMYPIRKQADNFIISEGVEKIAESAFQSAPHVKFVTIPKSVSRLGDGAFLRCKDLEKVTFAPGSKIRKIGKGAFRNCPKLKSIRIPATVKKLFPTTFLGKKEKKKMTIYVKKGSYAHKYLKKTL